MEEPLMETFSPAVINVLYDNTYSITNLTVA